MQRRVLLVEDDLAIAHPLKLFLEDHGLFVTHTADGGKALDLYKKRSPEIIILDIILPNMNGFDIIQEIRKMDRVTPIVMMTGTEIDEESEIRGYESGAVNYIKKPVYPQAILALIRTLLFFPKGVKKYHIGRSEIVVYGQKVQIDGNNIVFKEKDAQIFHILLKQAGIIVPRTDILIEIWKDDDPALNTSLDVIILRIRRALNPVPYIKIRSVYGVGYMLEVE